ncbi:Cyclin, C-terminal domain, partial [Dillenia turbinata]
IWRFSLYKGTVSDSHFNPTQRKSQNLKWKRKRISHKSLLGSPRRDLQFLSSSPPESKKHIVSSDLMKTQKNRVEQTLKEKKKSEEKIDDVKMDQGKRPVPNYMEVIQKDLTARMGEILIDWLVEVAWTLYLAVSYVDRFLSSHAISRASLQLLGVSCMLIAAKYEETSKPHVTDFCYITDNTYTTDEVVDTEESVLKFLNFEMGTPTIKTFLRRFSMAVQESNQDLDMHFKFLTCYLAELRMADCKYVWFLPSMVAASAIFLANFTLQPMVHPWNLTPAELKDCALSMHGLQSRRRGKKCQQYKLNTRSRSYIYLYLLPYKLLHGSSYEDRALTRFQSFEPQTI